MAAAVALALASSKTGLLWHWHYYLQKRKPLATGTLATLPARRLHNLNGAYNFRIKAKNKRELHDGYVMSRLFVEIYGKAQPDGATQ